MLLEYLQTIITTIKAIRRSIQITANIMVVVLYNFGFLNLEKKVLG